jgi:hypothetical protein
VGDDAVLSVGANVVALGPVQAEINMIAANNRNIFRFTVPLFSVYNKGQE